MALSVDNSVILERSADLTLTLENYEKGPLLAWDKYNEL